MKKIFSFTKKKKNPSSTPDSGSVLSVGYDLKEKDLSKVHKAAFLGDVAKLKQLVKKNDINQLDKENRTALHIACASGHADVVQFLVESKAKLNLCDNQNKSALMKAVQGQHERCVNVLLENHAEPNLVDINGNTALHLAANIPAISTAMLLVENEADINAQNKEGFTPLAVSVREEHMEMAEFLLKEGADVNFLDKDRRSPLMLAAGNGQICMLQLLLRFDADITLKDTKGWSSDDYAVMNGHHPCSLLITEHGTKKNAMSLSQVSSKKRKALLGSPSHDVEAGFSLGGPATDKDDAEDNSQSESLSRVSKSAGDDWPSSGDDDDEPHLISKNAQKVNLRKLIASKKGEATPQPDRPLGGTESESESEDRVQRIPSLPKALPFNRALQHPVAPSPASFSKAPQRSSALLPKSSMLEDSTLDDDDDDDDDDNDGEEKRNDDEEDEEEDISDETDEDGDPPAPPTPDYENGVYKDNKRDFLSELGLEKGREEQDSLDSESLSEDPDKPLDVNLSSHTQEAQEEMSTVEEENKKDLFYIPSFLRGEGGNRMAVLEHRRSVVRTGACQLVANSGDDSGDELVPKGAAMDKESERARWEPLSVLSKLEGENEQKTGKDLMEELGLGNVDDLEDASDWDSASTASKRTLPGRRMVSPGLEEHPECSTPSVQDEDISPATAPTTHKHMDSGEGLPSTPPQTVPQPQPRARKMLLPKQESDDESDLESDNLTSSFSAAKTDNQLSNTAEHLATVGPGSAKWPPVARDNESNMKSDKQLQEVDQERTQSAIAAQISSVSRNPGATVLKGMHTEKPETGLQCQKEMSSPSGATPKEQQPTATGSAVQTLLSDSPKRFTAFHSTNGPPELLHLPLQQTSSFKQEGEAVAVEETSQVRGARRSRAPQTSVHVNGDPLSVFDDSTLSEVSDDDGRLSSGDQHKNEAPGEMEMAEDFDELTQSSDTATDDIDSPTNSGYRHASLLIQKLDSTTLDSRSMVKLQNIFHEYERSIQKTRSRHWYLTEKVNQMELERTELKSSLEETKDMKSVLERNQLELQTEVTNLKFQLKQEQENRRNATMMYNTSRDKLKRIEEHQQVEIQERQKVELTLRNLELENRTLANNIKQLEEDHSETQRLLAQERSARTLQENLLNSHLRKQQEMEQESKIHLSKSNEALSQLTEASDREKELLQQSGLLKEELSILKSDRERSQANSRLKESHLVEENEVLKEQLEDARRDLKLNNEALTQAAFNYNNQLATLKSDLAVTTTRLENERQARETADTEVETARNRQVGSIQEAERCLADKADTERALLREKEDHQRLKDKLTSEAASQRDTVSSLSQNLSKAEAHANSLDNELHRATLQLTEKGLLLDVLQREKDQAAARGKELETTLQAEREQVSRAGARQEATQERLVQAQSESMLLRQQLEEAQNKGVAKERAVTDAQDRFGDMLSKLRSDCDERVQLVEEKSKDLASKAADLREQVYKLEEEKNDKESGLRQLQQELADSLKKLSMSEATLEVNTRYRNDLEEEKSRLQKEIDRVKEKLQEREDQYVQAERRINSLRGNVDAKERELGTAAQKLQEALSTSAGSDTTIKQLEDAVQGLEIENARLEAAAKQQSHKIEALQKGAQEGAMLTDGSPGGGVRSHLEDLITNLQSSKMTLEDQLNQEVQKQSMLSHTAQDSQALWEEEMKSRSKLGLRLAELEKEKGELNTQVEIERMKASKMAEQKSASDSRLDQEMKRNTDLHKEMYRLRSLLKTAKKKLHDQDSGGTEFGSPRSRMESGRHSQAEGGFGQMQEKVDDLQGQLRKEASHCSQLERLNRELKEELVSLKNPSHNNDQQERSKRQLEEEIAGARRQLESQAEQYRREAEERARQEVLQKLGQVNLFLQSQAASQDEVDQIKAANEANLRSRLDQVTRELEKERGRARKSEQDSLSQRDTTRTELDRYHHLYDEELQRRKSLAAKLDRSNSRLAEANSLLLNERSKPLFASSFANSGLGGPPLGVSSLGSLGSTTHYGGTRGPLTKSLGLGLAAEGQGTRVEDLLSEMQSELARATSRELNKAKAELDNGSSPGSFGVELDPLLRVKKEYLDVLKKNYSI
ncbi:ankyrin repeat domain-containing protein 26 isoform X8 [Genypterus blacodes]|uniref:ankyrin repeat domain-containing protein 26 isoform X8 n=1 Tax=Genypterus blacodes TaxID=154954 RepID=UPI003F768EB9